MRHFLSIQQIHPRAFGPVAKAHLWLALATDLSACRGILNDLHKMPCFTEFPMTIALFRPIRNVSIDRNAGVDSTVASNNCCSPENVSAVKEVLHEHCREQAGAAADEAARGFERVTLQSRITTVAGAVPRQSAASRGPFDTPATSVRLHGDDPMRGSCST